MQPQIRLRSDDPNVTHTAGGAVMTLQPYPGEDALAFAILRCNSAALDQRAVPVERTSASAIQITIQDINVEGRTILRRKQPLRLVAQRHERGGCYHADFPDLDVPIAGYSQEDLIAEVHALVVSTWRRWMNADEATLAPLPIALRERLRTQYHEVE